MEKNLSLLTRCVYIWKIA